MLFLWRCFKSRIQPKDLSEDLLASINGCHTVDDRGLLLLEVLNFLLENLCHNLHVEDFNRLDEGDSML